MKVKVILRDDDNKDYRKELVINLSNLTYDIIDDCMSTYSDKEYDNAWNEMCDIVEATAAETDPLPFNWYIDKFDA